MWSKVKSFILESKKVAGLELVLLADDKIDLTLCILYYKKGVVTVEKKVSKLDRWEDVQQYLSDDLPVALVMNGKSILHKRIETPQPGVATIEKLKVSIPNLNPKEFYLQDCNFKGGCFLSLIRRELLDKILDKLAQLNMTVVSVTAGPFVFSHLKDFIQLEGSSGSNFEADEQDILVHTHQLTLKDGEIVQYRALNQVYSNQSFQIGEELLDSKWVLSYAAALNALVMHREEPFVLIERVVETRDEWEQKKLFRVAGWSVLLIFLAILFTNFLLFSSLNQHNIDLALQVDRGDKSAGRMEKLRVELKDCKHFLTNAGWLKPAQNSYYADRLVSTVPSEVTLIELSVNPLDERRSKTEKKLFFIPGVVSVKGICADPQSLNSWLKDINQLSWVKEIREHNYRYDNTKRIGYFDFQVVFDK